jgi:transaldolase
MVGTTATDFWNDSCATDELAYAIEHGATGATTNPSIVLDVLRKELGHWRGRLSEIVASLPTGNEVDVTWALIEQMAVRGAALLEPVFEREGRRKGRLSIQTSPTLYRDAAAIVEQAERFAGLAPNLQVKIPATKAGIAAIEEATFRGINVNATVSFTVSQTLAVAAAVERGLDRRTAAGLPVADMSPVCTLMVGRLDDWLKVVAAQGGLTLTPGTLDWPGIAAFKRAYALYRERGYRTRLLAAAYRHHLHWSELIGGDVVLTIPHAWQVRFNASDIEVRARMDDPVPPRILAELEGLPDFRRAMEPEGLSLDEIDTFGATRRTLRAFLTAYHDLQAVVRDAMLPDPDRA